MAEITKPRVPHSDNFEDDPTRELQGPEGEYHVVVVLRLPTYDRPVKMENSVSSLLRDIHVKNNPKASVDSWHWEASTRTYPFHDPEEENPDGGNTPEPEKADDGPSQDDPASEPGEDACNDRASQTSV